MGIMDILKKIGSKKHKFKHIEDEQKFMEKLSERRKSANERELEGYMKEEREKKIKEKLGMYRKKREIEGRKNMFVGNKNLFNGETNMLKSNGSFLFR